MADAWNLLSKLEEVVLEEAKEANWAPNARLERRIEVASTQGSDDTPSVEEVHRSADSAGHIPRQFFLRVAEPEELSPVVRSVDAALTRRRRNLVGRVSITGTNLTDVMGLAGKITGVVEAETRRQSSGHPLMNQPWIVTLVGGLLLIPIGTAVTVLITRGTPSSTTYPVTVENVVSHGVWTRQTPSGELADVAHKPLDARTWLPEGQVERVICGQAGGPYPTVVSGAHVTWRWWLRLADHTWIQSAAVQQTDVTGDGPIPGIPTC